VGSVFSPYYAAARRKNPLANPEEYCALNVALYGKGGHRWAMTERGKRHTARSATDYRIGPSHARFDGHSLVIEVRERMNPLPRALTGTIRITPRAMTQEALQLDASGRHIWWPIGPLSDIEVNLTAPEMRWSGRGYLDSNWGDEPLEAGFTSWEWSRQSDEAATTVQYDLVARDGTASRFGVRIGADGAIAPCLLPPQTRMPRTLWGVRGDIRAGQPLASVKTVEDTPFYTRSMARGMDGTEIFHESLDLDRFKSRWVQVLLPFRMPRRG
jgi:carotenoid 1,2-hydratase